MLLVRRGFAPFLAARRVPIYRCFAVESGKDTSTENKEGKENLKNVSKEDTKNEDTSKAQVSKDNTKENAKEETKANPEENRESKETDDKDTQDKEGAKPKGRRLNFFGNLLNPRVLFVVCAFGGIGVLKYLLDQWGKPYANQEDSQPGVLPPVDDRMTSTAPRKLHTSRRNPVVFLDISIDGEPVGRIYIRLRGDKAPLTVENFLSLCKNDPQRTLQNTGFHRALHGALIQGGRLPAMSEAPPNYVVGETFELKPDGPYWVGMAETKDEVDPDHSQFFITTNPTPTLEGKHVIFGRVIEGYPVVHAMEGRFTLPGSEEAIRVTRAAEVESEERMEFIRGSLPMSTSPLDDILTNKPKAPKTTATTTTSPVVPTESTGSPNASTDSQTSSDVPPSPGDVSAENPAPAL